MHASDSATDKELGVHPLGGATGKELGAQPLVIALLVRS